MIDWPRAGDRMKFLGQNGYDAELEEAKRLFTVGGVYTVTACDVGSWSHSVTFEEVAGRFNGVMFERLPAENGASSPAERRAGKEARDEHSNPHTKGEDGLFIQPCANGALPVLTDTPAPSAARQPQPFERYPPLASWIERLGNSPNGLSLGEWMVFVGALNNAIARAERGEAIAPHGWQIAPREPTPEMLAVVHPSWRAELAANYRAMLAAAPAAPDPSR